MEVYIFKLQKELKKKEEERCNRLYQKWCAQFQKVLVADAQAVMISKIKEMVFVLSFALDFQSGFFGKKYSGIQPNC